MVWGWGNRDGPLAAQLWESGLGGRGLGQADPRPQLHREPRPGPATACFPCSASVAVFGEVRDGPVLLALAAVPGLPAGPLPAHVCQVSEGPPGLGAADGEYRVRAPCASARVCAAPPSWEGGTIFTAPVLHEGPWPRGGGLHHPRSRRWSRAEQDLQPDSSVVEAVS